jgi:hypothetical protein
MCVSVYSTLIRATRILVITNSGASYIPMMSISSLRHVSGGTRHGEFDLIRGQKVIASS